MSLSREEVNQEAPLPTNPAVTLFVVVAVFICIFTLIGFNRGWFDTKQTRQEKLWTRAIQEDYLWLKTRAAELEEDEVKIAIGEAKHIEESRKAHKDLSEMGYKVETVLLPGSKMIFNRRAAEYNERMARWEWRFANIDNLPKGVDKPLPREFELYTIPGEK